MKNEITVSQKRYKTSSYVSINPLSWKDLNPKDFSPLHAKAEEDDVRAQIVLAICYADGRLLEVDYSRSAYWFRRAALLGDVFSQFQLAYYYAEGVGVRRNTRSAAAWMDRVANFGNAEAKYVMSEFLREGVGVKADCEMAFFLTEDSICQSYVPAINKLGFCYLFGIGTAIDEKKAAQLFLEAAESGFPDGQWYAHQCYEKGIGVPCDDKKALYWLKKYNENNGFSNEWKFYIEKVMLNIRIRTNEEQPWWQMEHLRENFILYCMHVAMSHLIGRFGCEKNDALAQHWFDRGELEIPSQLCAVDRGAQPIVAQKVS